MIQASNVTVQFGGRALFERVNAVFSAGNCYGIIGANGAGKSTFLKVLSGDLEPQKGEVIITPGERLSVLEQDHFKYDEYEVVRTVLMGNPRLIEIMEEKDALYAKPDFSEEDGIRAGELEAEFADLDGWNAESDAEFMLNKLGVTDEYHYMKMSELPSDLKVKVLLARLFSVIRIFFCLMSQQTTLIWLPFVGLKISFWILKTRLLLFRMIGIFSIKCALIFAMLISARFKCMPATMIFGMNTLK